MNPHQQISFKGTFHSTFCFSVKFVVGFACALPKGSCHIWTQIQCKVCSFLWASISPIFEVVRLGVAVHCHTAYKIASICHCVGVVSSWYVLLRRSKHKVFKDVCNLVQLQIILMNCVVHYFVLCPLCSLALMKRPFLCGHLLMFLVFLLKVFWLRFEMRKNSMELISSFLLTVSASQVSSHCLILWLWVVCALAVIKKKVKAEVVCALFFSFHILVDLLRC